jgi:hypothetical protein
VLSSVSTMCRLVEHEPLAFDVGGNDGVIVAAFQVVHDDQALVALGDAGFAQRDIFGDA